MEAKQHVANEICPTTTQEWIRNGAILVDVREKIELEQLSFDVPRLIHIPLGELEARYNELPTDKHLVIVCRVGMRSLLAAGFLVNKGYDPAKVVNMKHGIVRWVQRGFPTKGDVSAVASSGDSQCCSSSPANEKGGSCCNTADKNRD